MSGMRYAELRKKIRAQRKNLLPSEVSAYSACIAEKIIRQPIFYRSQHIGYYHASDNEVDPQPVAIAARALQKITYLPILTPQKTLLFCPIHHNTRLVENQFHIVEPDPAGATLVTADQLDLLLVPLVAFDAACHRLGRGAGYYDRTLQYKFSRSGVSRPVLIGLAYDFQRVDEIMAESWDVPMDNIVTEASADRP